ncbi:hypothetical protein LINGRAHAP2_LOCUS23265, partial [Linum grandiflorum]
MPLFFSNIYGNDVSDPSSLEPGFLVVQKSILDPNHQDLLGRDGDLLSSSYVIINGCPTSTFGASHGLRQGDLFSHLLFSICIEELISLLHHSIINC